MRHIFLLCATAGLIPGCNSESSIPTTGPTVVAGKSAKVVDTYAKDMEESAKLVSAYVRYWERNKKWPEPGTYQSDNIIFKGSEPSSTSFPDRRRDFYCTLHRDGKEFDLKLWTDGRCEVSIISDDLWHESAK
jgi:hypothetical protein